LQLVRDGKVSGLRVDHIDGLCDPAEYLARLHAAVKDVAPEHNLYIVVEKILARDEPLPEQWPVCGTTGYDFLNAVNDIFLEPQGIKSLEAAYARFTGDADSFDEICYKRNKQVMEQLFAGEVNALGHHLGRLAARDWQARDVPLSELVRALVETTACLALYRTYIRCFEISERDRFYLVEALEAARQRTQETEIGTPAFQFLRSVLFLEPPFYAPEQKHEYLSFVMHWQQFTGPVMAKGLEDTASYVYSALISRNEVGGDPLRRRPPLNLDEFHQFNQLRLSRWPFTLNATSTHDTKRSEDVRARLNVLSEIAPQWERNLERWRSWNGGRKTIVNGIAVPAPSEEVLIYQTLLGSWPLDAEGSSTYRERITQFAVKAMREAKTYSRWTLPNEEHESAVVRFIEAILTPSEDNLFLNDFLPFMERIARHGALNSLSQLLIKITAPGVPDIYQGMELWNLSLVDPDNRRPVNFRKRIDMLAELRKCETEHLSLLLTEMVREWKDGRIKLFVSDKALDSRREHAPVFLQGEYVPLIATGLKAANICAFARRHEGFWCLTAAPRWTTQLVEDGAPLPNGSHWEDTALQLPQGVPERWRNLFTGEEVSVSISPEGTVALALRNVLDQFPVALLSSI
ncbi:MAG: malto-oligosyltrehalose synthase, partial [Acidobacteria bacterium]|nr:malto-oligosyltrehalose synthase [Acidobacteriota bacterium]